jgi:hypothetical protein
MSPSLVVMISLTRSTVQFYMLTRTLADMVHSLLLPHLLTDNDDTERQDFFFFPFPFLFLFFVLHFIGCWTTTTTTSLGVKKGKEKKTPGRHDTLARVGQK